MGMVKQDDGWRLPDELWEQMAPLLPLESPIRWAVTIRVCQIGQQ
jgi:hypothetical protein